MKPTKRHLQTVLASGSFVAAVAVFSVAAPAQEEEIEAPAGDLTEAEAPVEGDGVPGEPAAGDAIDPNVVDVGIDPRGKADGQADDRVTEDGSQSALATWESYGDPTGGVTVAEEITGGVRVEDIVEPPADYRYAAFGKPDPFVPPMITEDSTVDPLEIPIVSPLQRFPLTELGLVGVWQLSSGERKAMVMTPEGEGGGQGIIVKNGDPIANRGGKILSIGDDYLTVREFSLAADGTRQFEDRQLFMGKRTSEESGKLQFTPGKKDTLTLDDTSGRVIYGDEKDSFGAGVKENDAPALNVPAPGEKADDAAPAAVAPAAAAPAAAAPAAAAPAAAAPAAAVAVPATAPAAGPETLP